MKWWMVIPLGVAGLLAAVTKGAKQTREVVNYTVAQWQSYLTPLCESARVSLPFAMSWARVESGGNPCAWGKATAKGPDGHPREQGLGQFYNPDDFTRYGIPSGAFRVYCTPGTQDCNRALTPAEMQAQAEALVKLITHCREVAGAQSAKNGLNWSGKDMYKLVKLVHGLPGLVKGVTAVTQHLGRPPHDWQEYKVGIAQTKLDTETEKYRSEFSRLFANAEKVTASLPDDVRVVS